MKLVLNKCYGGFNLSPKAQRKYVQLKYKSKLYFYTQTKFNYKDGVEEYTRIDKGFNVDLWYDFALMNDLGKTVSQSGLKKAKFFQNHNIDRNDPILVKIVEKMGKEANGKYADLMVVEIPDDVSYEIEEYDGREWVAESHRTW